MEYATKTELYQKVKKPLLERQRRARINKCLTSLKQLMCEMQGNPAIMRMDKAEMLENTIAYMRLNKHKNKAAAEAIEQKPMDSFRAGYMNAVNEVSRVLASTPGMTIDMGKSVMTHLGKVYNGLQQEYEHHQQQQASQKILKVQCPSLSPASSGYHSDSDCEMSPIATSTPLAKNKQQVWRPW